MANKEAKAKKENNKNKKSFFKDFKAELKKVSWPTPKQLVNNTIAVVTIVIITAVIVFVLDVIFETLNKHGIDKIKEVTDNTTVEENNDNATGNETTIDTTTEDGAEGNTQETAPEVVEQSGEENTQTNVEANTEATNEANDATQNNAE